MDVKHLKTPIKVFIAVSAQQEPLPVLVKVVTITIGLHYCGVKSISTIIEVFVVPIRQPSSRIADFIRLKNFSPFQAITAFSH